MDVATFKDNLTGMIHSGTLNKVRNVEMAMHRAANTLLSKIDPIDTMRIAALSNSIHDDVYNYSLPSDYKKIIDLIPQNRRGSYDVASRGLAEAFDLRKGLESKKVSIEGSEGTKIIRINWRSRAPKTLNEANTLTANGAWAIVGTASGLKVDTIDYVSGSGSLRFDVAITGDGIQNSSMTAVDLTDEDEVGDLFVWVKIPTAANLANLTSIALIWGNDLTANYWTGVAQTVQADGSAFKVGWNEIKVPWSTATETGTVLPASIDSLKLTLTIAGAISNIQVDNIACSLGRNFDIKYYSKFLIKNAAGTWISTSTADSDTVVLDDDAIQIYLLESLKAVAHQIEATDSVSDVNYSNLELETLYKKYKKEYPSQSLKPIGSYGSNPSRGRW
jgi:hypothetical protein